MFAKVVCSFQWPWDILALTQDQDFVDFQPHFHILLALNVVESITRGERSRPLQRCRYVQLLVAQKLDKGIRKQIASFCKGLWSFIPRALLSLFDEFELELLISGIPTIDVADWRANCK